MTRKYTGLCLATAAAFAAAAEAQTTTTRTNGARSAARDVTLLGCVQQGLQPESFVLNLIGSAQTPNDQSTVPIAPGTLLRLVGLQPADFQDYLGERVEVFGMMLPQQSVSVRRTGTPAGEAKINVRTIRQLDQPCTPASSAAAPAPAAPAAAPAAVSVAAPGRRAQPSSTKTRPGAATQPGAPAARPSSAVPTDTGGTQGSTTSPAATQAPTNATGTNAGLSQSGFSGSATLGGTFAMTPPTITFGTAPRPGTIPTSTAPTIPTSTSPATTTPTSTTPTATTPTSTTPTSTSPISTTPGVSQGSTNTTDSNATLDQVGVTGDAMLSGIVNVNIQQLLASVQLIANINVQDVIVNVSDVLNDNQIQALVQALNTNPQAALNANELSSALQQAGVLDPSQLVVGVTGAHIYENRSLATALVERGIIQPSETIMTTTPSRIYVLDQ